jgi:hypothetical protein
MYLDVNLFGINLYIMYIFSFSHFLMITVIYVNEIIIIIIIITI